MRNPLWADEYLSWLYDACYCREKRGASSHRALLLALTDRDHRVLEAIDRLWELHGCCGHPGRVITAIALIALEMQESTRPLARELELKARPYEARSWEQRLWPEVELAMERLGGRS